MSRKYLFVVLLLLPLVTFAQSNMSEQSSMVKFGYLSFSEVLQLMPEYITAQEKLNKLQDKYDEELAPSSPATNWMMPRRLITLSVPTRL